MNKPYTLPLALAMVTAIAVLLGGARIGHADTLGLVVAGDPGKISTVTDAVTPWLTENGHQVKLGALDPVGVKALVDCFIVDDEACARPLVAQVGLPRLAFIMIQVDRNPISGAETSTLTGWLFSQDGAVRAAERRQCEACKAETLFKVSVELAGAMLAISGGATATLSLSSTPIGAKVDVDGMPVGATPVTYQVSAGRHTVTFSLDGRAPIAREISVTPNETQAVSVSFDPSPAPGRVVTKNRGLAFALIGVGVAAVIAGATLVVLDEDPSSANTAKPTYRDTALMGGVIGAGGGVIAGAGIYLLIRGRQVAPDSGADPISPTSPSSISLGWAGKF